MSVLCGCLYAVGLMRSFYVAFFMSLSFSGCIMWLSLCGIFMRSLYVVVFMWLTYVVALCGCLYLLVFMFSLYLAVCMRSHYVVVFMRLSLCGYLYAVIICFLSLCDRLLWLPLYGCLYAMAFCGCHCMIDFTLSLYVAVFMWLS